MTTRNDSRYRRNRTQSRNRSACCQRKVRLEAQQTLAQWHRETEGFDQSSRALAGGLKNYTESKWLQAVIEKAKSLSWIFN